MAVIANSVKQSVGLMKEYLKFIVWSNQSLRLMTLRLNAYAHKPTDWFSETPIRCTRNDINLYSNAFHRYFLILFYFLNNFQLVVQNI